MKESKFAIVIQYLVGAFILPEYHFNHLEITNVKRHQTKYINHYSGTHLNRFKSNIKIRNFNRGSKTNFI